MYSLLQSCYSSHSCKNIDRLFAAHILHFMNSKESVIPDQECKQLGVYTFSILRVNHSAKYKVWRLSRDVDVKLGGVISRSCKGRETTDAILHTQNMWHRNAGL